MPKVFKTIIDGDFVNDIKTVSVGLSTVRATMFPRALLGKYSETPEKAAIPGLYILYNETSNGNQSIYIGETENLAERLKQHDKNMGKLFWTHTITFYDNGKHLNKAHYKNLEYKLYSLAKNAERATIINKVIPTESTLSEEDETLAVEFLNTIRTILAMFNYKFLEPTVIGAFEEDADLFYLAYGPVCGKLRVESRDKMFLVKGSTCYYKDKHETTENFYPMIEYKNKLLSKGILSYVDDTNILVVNKDIEFDSENEACAFVTMSCDIECAEDFWKDRDGYSFYNKITFPSRKQI